TTDSDYAGLADARTLTTAFISQLRGRSAFYTLIDGNMLTRVPFQTRFSYLTTDATAWIVAQGGAVPVSAMALQPGGLERLMAAGILVLTDEMVRSAGPAGEM